MENTVIHQEEAICALATANGVGAIAVIRISGFRSVEIVNTFFKGRDLTRVKSHTVHFGTIRDSAEVIDEVLVTVFRSPASFTREDAVEISCHGSDYIIRRLLKLLVRGGARMANPGEFTQRAFLNGQFDLVQAEAVADLIAADSEASHRAALQQLRGGFSKQLASLREELIHFASLVELELDFGEEDVEFAGRDDLRNLINHLNDSLLPLISSFDLGNALKEGVPVAIIGAPNVGKSTLLNALLNEEKAIVTAIAGTTRDVIEDTMVLGGIRFRFIDTAGIRETRDVVEAIGIERSKKAMAKADIILLLFDSEETFRELEPLAAEIPDGKKVLWVRNKVDLGFAGEKAATAGEVRGISAATGEGLEELKQQIIEIAGSQSQSGIIVTNLRHYEHLLKTHHALNDVLRGLDDGVSGDFLAQDIRLALFHLGEITGAIVTDDLLANIFSRFCIGK
ncbi:MAG: tRNA uridine-5-carboxymethylaminomethyl(34) synthesis GTPase MnmE [Cytophagaceae bacterium SCN 52-12]|nr:MAG: tRNA uridine-5-carboxymethylaminomethyl(34) synthesis GTPase MnmE [Cytophagaceae bacterium SCN 52-12]